MESQGKKTALHGMSETLGLATFEEVRSPFLPTRAVGRQEYSEDTSRLIDGEIRKFLSESHDRVRKTLSEKRKSLEAVAALLAEKEVIDRTALVAIVESAPSLLETVEAGSSGQFQRA